MTVGTRESPWDVAHVWPALTAPALGSLLIGMVTLFSFPVAVESPTAGGLRWSLPDSMQSEGTLACVSSSDLAPLVVMNPGSSVPAELRAGVIIGGMDG